MDAFVDTLVQLLIDWGYVGLFISALLAGSIIPFSSIRIYVIIAYVLSGAFIGALGSVVFTRKHINV